MTLIDREAESAGRRLLSLLIWGSITFTCALGQSGGAGAGLNSQDQVARYETTGDLNNARALLEEAAKSGESSPSAAFAEFLDRHGDPARRDAYSQWAAHESDPAKRKLALRQIVLLDMADGNGAHLVADLKDYRAAGGTDLNVPAKGAKPAPFSTVSIPGPISSFARMAALAPDVAPEELLPALARNVVTNGYQAAGNESLEQTEYLRLVTRYISQARELQYMAGSGQKIVVPTCDSEATGNLLKILGYRMRGSCGSDIVLETVNATRAFLTVDSGFPLSLLEQELRANHRFEMAYAPTLVPVLYDSAYWLSALGKAGQSDFLDAFLSDPSLCRLYLGLSHVDRVTAEALRRQAPAGRLKLYAHVLDFYGSMFQIRNGVAVVPGSAKGWSALCGVSPSNPGAFYDRLISFDDGWLASYFDALSRVDGAAAAYLTQPERLRRFYDALRGKVTSPGPARPVFRSSTELMLLTASIQVDANGRPHVPGELEVWRNLFIKHPHGKYDGKLTRAASSWRSDDDLIEALFALSRKSVENEPLKMYLLLSDIDRGRAAPLSTSTVSRLIAAFRSFGPQYSVFVEAPSLSESSIVHYLDTGADIGSIRDQLLKADTAGSLQALVAIWQVLGRQRNIPVASQDASFAKLIAPFAHLRGETELFEASRTGVRTLLAAANGDAGSTQDALVKLLVGSVRGGVTPTSPAENFLRIFDEQRLVPLDTLFLAADRLGKGSLDPKAAKIIREQLGRLEETESLRTSLSSEEKNAFAVGYWSQRHVDAERKFDVDNVQKNPEKKDPHALLAPFLRDSLVGLLYSYYAPPGAQILHTNPVFVRNHDFIGPEGSPSLWHVTEVVGSGWPASSGGRLSGSLVSLPYALAEAEQNFLSPSREQALIWSDLVPQIIVDVTVTRWRNVTPDQLRWVALHMRRGRNLLAAAALDPTLMSRVLDSYHRFTTPARVEWLQDHLQPETFATGLAQVQPSVLYALAQDPALKNLSPDLDSLRISEMEKSGRTDLTPVAIANAFGTPKPTLTHSYGPGILNLRTFPTLMGYSSRILAETWESNNLYFAALAEETGTPVDQLDAYVPEWNRSTIENIFATHLEDWPALLRSLNSVGDAVRQHGNQRSAVNTSN